MKKFAMIFPGQGSQSIGMLAELATQYPVVEETFQQASDVLGYDLWQLAQQGPAEELNKTWKTQPALLAASVAIYRVWQQKYPDHQATVMAGHSLGEYSALVCSGVMDFQEAIELVQLRGKLMQQAVPEGTGAMYAILGLENDKILEICQQAAQDEVVSAVNFNSPGQVVIAGHKNAVERAAHACKEAGAKRAMPLAVSVPSHCVLMKPAADQLAVALENMTLKTPKVALINNVDVKVETNTNDIRSALIRQLYNPVRWTEIVQRMAQMDVEVLVEVGPNKVLTGLTKRITDQVSSIPCYNLSTLDAVENILN